jgi:hypothetical protein
MILQKVFIGISMNYVYYARTFNKKKEFYAKRPFCVLA